MIYNYPYFGFPNYMNSFKQLPNTISYPNFIKINSQAQPKILPKYPPNYLPNYQYKKNNTNIQKPNFKTYKKQNDHTSDGHSINNNNSTKSSENPIFNILGISLYFDDILLICMIFFLYNEKIDDNYLLLSLVLLLLG